MILIERSRQGLYTPEERIISQSSERMRKSPDVATERTGPNFLIFIFFWDNLATTDQDKSFEFVKHSVPDHELDR